MDSKNPIFSDNLKQQILSSESQVAAEGAVDAHRGAGSWVKRPRIRVKTRRSTFREYMLCFCENPLKGFSGESNPREKNGRDS